MLPELKIAWWSTFWLLNYTNEIFSVSVFDIGGKLSNYPCSLALFLSRLTYRKANWIMCPFIFKPRLEEKAIYSHWIKANQTLCIPVDVFMWTRVFWTLYGSSLLYNSWKSLYMKHVLKTGAGNAAIGACEKHNKIAIFPSNSSESY